MDMPSLENVRIALLISLSLLVVAVAYRRFRRHVLARHMPVMQHAELGGLTVAYHPLRIRAEVKVPARQSIRFVVLGPDHGELHSWPGMELQAGGHTIELDMLPGRAGDHYLELRTDSQCTVRKFTIRP